MIAKYSDKQISIIMGGYTEILPYEINYHKYNSFINGEHLKVLPFYYDMQLVYNNLEYYESVFIDVKRDRDTVEITSLDPLVYISVNEKKFGLMPVEINELVKSPIGREYQSISFLLNKENRNSVFIYHDGKEWNLLK